MLFMAMFLTLIFISHSEIKMNVKLSHVFFELCPKGLLTVYLIGTAFT